MWSGMPSVTGSEGPSERLAAGKRAEGEIVISAPDRGEKVIIEVQDDGRGVDLERVTSKARAAGLIGLQENVDAAHLLEVICVRFFHT